ncbi:hypothetical protein N9174_01500 [bacterium]|nr:hypothetical protein [bacterium]
MKISKKNVIVHGGHRLSTDRRDIPVPPNGAAGLENPAYRAFVVPVNGYKRIKLLEGPENMGMNIGNSSPQENIRRDNRMDMI